MILKLLAFWNLLSTLFTPPCFDLDTISQSNCTSFQGFHWNQGHCTNQKKNFNSSQCIALIPVEKKDCAYLRGHYWKKGYCYHKTGDQKLITCGCICPQDTCKIVYQCTLETRNEQLQQCSQANNLVNIQKSLKFY